MNLNDCERQKPLSPLCTFGIGGTAAYYVAVDSATQMQQALELCRQQQLPYHILGRGSNSLFSDRGFNGVIIHNKITFMQELAAGVFHVGAGTSFAWLGIRSAKMGWSGLEFAAGIPGSVGGAIYMNAGANGVETAAALLAVDFIDGAGHLQRLPREALHFGYRHSPFQGLPGAIVSATFGLTSAPLARTRQLAMVRKRQATQPLQHKSAGCIFRNPHPQHAGTLIEACGLKGLSIGGAQVSAQHANFIINSGVATASEVLALMSAVKAAVASKYEIHLESELQVIFDHYLEE
jgi:UDP-N-acetylmuramate dehydrogenase